MTSAYAGDEMPETQPPRAPERTAPDTAPDRLIQGEPDGGKSSRRTAALQAVRRTVKVVDSRRMREAAISVMVVVILVVGVVGNMPDAAITRAVAPIAQPISLSVGLDQNWSMFTPTPPQRLEYIEVHVVMASGADKVWTVPRRNQILGVAFSHRWRKFKEYLVTNDDIRPDFVHWVVRELTRPGDHPVRVDLLLRTEVLPPPGVQGPGSTGVQTLYSEYLTGTR
jgi:hypothetical protein